MYLNTLNVSMYLIYHMIFQKKLVHLLCQSWEISVCSRKSPKTLSTLSC